VRGVPLAVALVVGGVSVGAALRAFTWEPPPREPAIPAGDRERARALAARVASALIALQKEDGTFDRAPGDEDRDPEARRVASAALAAAALARARDLGIGGEPVSAALARALDRLKAGQVQDQPGRVKGGAFAAMETGVRADPRPSLEATSAAVMALALAGRPEDEASLRRGLDAFRRAVAYGAFQGWTRALAALAVDTVVARGRAGWFERPVADLVAQGPVDRVDCGDYRLAEAIVRRIRTGPDGDPLVGQVFAACVEDPDHPRWAGESTPVDSWYLQAWLAARSPGGAEWFRRAVPALEKGIGPTGRLPESVYADVVTQNACALLVLAEGLGSPTT
jgi:hypothetical protein